VPAFAAMPGWYDSDPVPGNPELERRAMRR
jgi:hypothetical protein